jgi:predicted RecA/RadA family phage recombinase
MQNYIAPGKTITITNVGAPIVSGQPVLVGTIVGFAAANIPNGQTGTLNIEGIYRGQKAGVAIAQGVAVYWDAGAGNFTTVALGNTFAGVAASAALLAAATVDIKIGPPAGIVTPAPAANVPAIGVTANLPVLATNDTYADADVNAVFAGAEARLDTIEGTVDAVIAALIAAGIMNP